MNFITGFGLISSPQVTSEQLVLLLELLLEEEELNKEAMEALQRAYNLQSQDAEVRPHTHTHTNTPVETGKHLRSSSVIPSNDNNNKKKKKTFFHLPEMHSSAARFFTASITGYIPKVLRTAHCLMALLKVCASTCVRVFLSVLCSCVCWQLKASLLYRGSLQARECENTAAAQYSVVNTTYLFILTWTFGEAVMFVICSCISVFYSNRSALIWGQSLDLWSNFLAESRFSSAVSWKNFQCLLKIAQGSTL